MKATRSVLAALLVVATTAAAADLTPQQSPLSETEKAVKAAVDKNRWMAKIAHVVQVTYGIVDANDTVAIVVVVDKPENLSEVERQIPSRLGGFPVEVEPVPIGILL
jgi:hypothetical protein